MQSAEVWHGFEQYVYSSLAKVQTPDAQSSALVHPSPSLPIPRAPGMQQVTEVEGSLASGRPQRRELGQS
jgi:hypothetical protein